MLGVEMLKVGLWCEKVERGTVMMIKMVMKVDGDGDCVWGDGGNEMKKGVGVACFDYREGDGD